MNKTYTLQQLGWKPLFQLQLSIDDLEHCQVGRVSAHHRSHIDVQLEQRIVTIPITSSLPKLTVGDWVLLNHEEQFERLLDRDSLISRKAAGSKVDQQLIASNVDTLFIVCSLNHDFNLNRIERYLIIAREANIEPVVILTKQDLVEDWQSKQQQVQALDVTLSVVSVNALEIKSVEPLLSWCRIGQTVSFVGSSGVGKSSRVNNLLGEDIQLTQGIREDDSKGRHTTTSRSMYFSTTGGILIYTPGMRELQLADCEAGLHQTFAEIAALEQKCQFSNCQHDTEPGCAINKALESGLLEPRRYENYVKLKAEQSRNSASLAEKRAKDKAFSKMCRTVIADHRRSKKGY